VIDQSGNTKNDI